MTDYRKRIDRKEKVGNKVDENRLKGCHWDKEYNLRYKIAVGVTINGWLRFLFSAVKTQQSGSFTTFPNKCQKMLNFTLLQMKSLASIFLMIHGSADKRLNLKKVLHLWQKVLLRIFDQ